MEIHYLFFQGKGKKEDIDRRVSQIKDEIELSNSEYEKEKLQERLAKLSRGVAQLKVSPFSVLPSQMWKCEICRF